MIIPIGKFQCGNEIINGSGIEETSYDEVPKILIEKLKEELPEGRKDAVFTSVNEIASISKKNDSEYKRMLKERGFKIEERQDVPGINAVLRTTSGDKQIVSRIKHVNDSSGIEMEKTWLELLTVVGDTESRISYDKRMLLEGAYGQITITNEYEKDGKPVRKPIEKMLHIKKDPLT